MTLEPREIIARLIEAGDTQKDIEAGSGVPQATISRILSGAHSSPRWDTVSKLNAYSSRRLQPPAKAAS